MRSIASNPLLPDDLTLEDFFRVIEKYGLVEKLPPSISSLIVKGRIPGLPCWLESEERRQVNIMLIENSDALRVACEVARNLGYETQVDHKNVEGEYKNIARELILELANLQKAHPNKKVCVISGGEASCPVSGRGIGGRNQEFVLYAASLLSASGMENAVVLSCGTDGIDGNSIATGAILSADAIRHANEKGFDLNSYFQANDSHSFFLEHGGLIVTGPAGNNIRDLRILAAGASSQAASQSQ
jgi:glycerate-2-kinase